MIFSKLFSSQDQQSLADHLKVKFYNIHPEITHHSSIGRWKRCSVTVKLISEILLLILLLYSCNRDQAFIEKGFEKESEGKIAEALHLYNQALKVNSTNTIANERMGFLLSESQFSIIPAMYHLELARNSDSENLKVGLKLVDLTLFVSDFSKSRRIQKEISLYLTNAENDTLSYVTHCLETKDEKERKKSFDVLSNTELSTNAKYIYRSLALCYELNGNSLKAEETVTYYRKILSESP